MKDLENIIEQARKALRLIEEGETYTSDYIIKRFAASAERNPNDQLIGNMRDVLIKRASSKMFFNQAEIGELYSKMYGLSGGHTAFRNELGDLLPNSLQLAKVAHSGSDIRRHEEVNPEPIYKDSELSNAFSVIFSMGSNSAFGSFKEADSNAVQQVVFSKLSKLGKTPISIKVAGQNEHFALATALYQDRNHNQLALQIPVPLSGGQPQEPTLMVEAGQLIDLNKENLYVHLKESSHYKKASAKARIGGDVGRDRVEIDKAVIPASLEKWADFDTDMIRAGKHFSPEQVNLGASMVSSEIASYTKVRSQVKVAKSDPSGIVFKATFPTPRGGNVTIDVPVEYHNGRPILPSRFAVNASLKDDIHSYFDFDKRGFESLWQQLSDGDIADSYNRVSRVHSEMGKMSYHQLMDQIITAAAKKDYAMAEDAIGVIRDNHGEDLALKALNKYASLLKYTSPTSSKRGEFVKQAKARGELIEIPTSVEPYAPKLGLPLSKIDFDSEGVMYPKGRVPKYDNQNDEIQVIQTSKIYLS